MAKTGLIQFRLDDKTLAWLASRASRMHTGTPHVQAREELGLWWMTLAAELRRLRFTLGELNCMADVLNGSQLDATMTNLPLTWAETEDTFSFATGPSSYGAKWGIDEQALLAKLRDLGPAADHALRDAVSRWWEGDQENGEAGWAAVGLRVVSGQPLSAEARGTA